MTVHNFQESLNDSKKDSKDPIWDNIYEYFFPGHQKQNYDNDVFVQLSGVDDILRHGTKLIWIDRKCRKPRKGKVYSDIALEYWSDEIRQVPGWLCKSTKADYWLYLNRMDNTCHLIPVKSVQNAWKKYEKEWHTRWPFQIKAFNSNDNRKWTTVSIGVPVDVLNNACQEFGEGIRSATLSQVT